MRKNDARQLDHATLEAMRERAVQSVQQGESPEDVARVLGINRSTIYKWLAEYRRGGWGALKAKPSHGATVVKASNLSELGPFHSVLVLIKARLGKCLPSGRRQSVVRSLFAEGSAATRATRPDINPLSTVS